MAVSRKVAVIGAGVNGLVTARELQRGGHQVVVFEKSNKLGGLWVYNPRVETDPLSLDPNREIIHSSLYKSLRTNLPRQLMSFSDYSFDFAENGSRSSFPGHEEVLKFLNKFAKDFGVTELIRFNTEVIRVEFGENHCVVESKLDELISEEEFDSVVICNGRHTIPRLADIRGINNWPGKQIHSHNYRVPEPFKDQIVVVIGDGPSGLDICRDIATVAKQVHLSTRYSEIEVSKLDNYVNLWNHSKIDHVDGSGEVTFLDGSSIHADIILHCTGYKYDFPFLETNGIVSVDDEGHAVGPLYKHVFPPKLSPCLSFVGIPYQGIIFLVCEFQAKWIALVLSGKVLLPSEEEMLADVEDHNRQLEEAGIPKRHTHRLHSQMEEYMDWITAQIGIPPVDASVKEMYWSLFKCVVEVGFDGYKDLYKYDFPFLKANGIVSVDDEGRAVGPLYEHVFPPKLSPCLSFVAIPYQGIVFLVCELQAKWIAQVLSGKVLLPSEKEMLADVEDHNRHLDEDGIPKRHTHRLHHHEVFALEDSLNVARQW